MTIIILTLICLLALGLFFYKKSQNIQRSKAIAMQDKAAQTVYDSKKYDKTEKKLSLQERIELSWKFLYEITEIVLNKFSSEDRQQVEEIGRNLSEQGMKYEHVIQLGIQPLLDKTTGVEQEMIKETNSRGI